MGPDAAGAAAAKLVCPACNSRYEIGQFCQRDGTPLVKDTTQRVDLVGKVIADRYRIVKLLGEGGMGQVYEAAHVNINKRFAIKLLRPEIVSNPDAVARFRQEAWSASSIGHDNIIEIDDFATLPDGSVYLAMEYLAGVALADRMVEEPPILIGEALQIFIQVSSGLLAAHEKGIVHRDMKPENVFLVEKSGRLLVKILDFGIAKVSGGESQSLTRTGAIFGTPHYMSPEQAIGNPLDHRSDIYSVGVIMYEVFTGKVPFEAESFMGILTKHITMQPKAPSLAAPTRNIPPEVESVIMRAMAKDPGDRQGSMAELRDELIAVARIYAAHILSSSGTQLSVGAPSSPSMRAASQPRAAVAPVARDPSQPGMPAARQPTPSQPIRTSQPSQPSLPPSGTAQGFDAAAEDLDSHTVPHKKSLLLPLSIVGALLLAGGGVAAFLTLSHPPQKTVEDPTHPVAHPTDPVKPVEPAVVANPNLPKMPDIPVPVADQRDLVIDSEPTGALIVYQGKVIGDTPEALKVPAHDLMKVVLRKDGYVDEPVVIDPAKGRKLVVQLDKVAQPRPAKKKSPVYSNPTGKLPAPPPVPVEPVAKPPVVKNPEPPIVKQPVKPTQPQHPIDPYERLDDHKRPTGEVLNPY